MSEYFNLKFIKDNFENDWDFYLRLCNKSMTDFNSRKMEFAKAIETENLNNLRKLSHYFESAFAHLGWSLVLSSLNQLSSSANNQESELENIFKQLCWDVDNTFSATNEIRKLWQNDQMCVYDVIP